ncbi:MAG: hypothetical protein IPJ97_18490 [Proteobacteria bacterium]|nr:hypothetical protein [Pseudomonadota bacterium]
MARLHGHDSDEVAEAEERFLQIAFQVVPGTFLRESLRLRAMSAAATVLDKESDRYLRRRAFALAVSLRVRPEAIAELAELREELLARMGEGHPDVIRTTWLFGRQILEFDRERAVALLAEAWSRAEGLPAGHEELQANVLRDHAACLDRQLDAETATKLGRQVLRLHMRLWGLGDPRTHEALACVSLDPGRLPDASAWYEQGLASIPRDEPGDELQFRILERLGAHANTPGYGLRTVCARVLPRCR